LGVSITHWLARLGLSQYETNFAENDIGEDLLDSLDNDDLKELGIPSLGHRKRILAAIAEHSASSAATPKALDAAPINYLPRHLAQRIMQSRYALEGERKQVTVLFADIKGSMALIAGADPDYAARLIDPVIDAMMSAIHRYDGTVNRVQGDGIMALFGAPIAQEDHALRACYAALAMRSSLAKLAVESRREIGVDVEVRMGLNSGEVIVRAIKNDLTINYDAMGETAHLASRMEQLAPTGRIRIAEATHALVRDFVIADDLGPIPIKGLDGPVTAYELTGASNIRTRIQASAVSGFSRFVGRTHELSTLEDAFDGAVACAGRVVGVVGEPGVGKSRLYYEFVRGAKVRNSLLLTCGSVSHGFASAYLPIADLIRDYFGVSLDDEPRRVHEKILGRLLTLDDALRSTLPALLSLLEIPVEDADWHGLDPSERREKIRESFRAVLLRESQVQPIVLLLEDLHWFDSESLGVLNALIGAIGGVPILVLVNFRPEFTETWASRAAYTRVRLEPLGPQSMASLLEHLLGTSPELEQLRRTLVSRTEGNPLFIEESVRSMVETGALIGTRGNYQPSSANVPFDVPVSVQSVLAARMDRLEPDAKRLLQCASVIGKDFSFQVLQGLSELDPASLDAQLGLLKEGEFIHEVKLFPDKEYTFKHALTHQVTYGSLVSHRKVDLHSQVLRLVEVQWKNPTNEQLQHMARHALAGEFWEDAARYGREAGLRLAEQNATRPAAIAFETALDALAKLPYTEARARVRIELCFRLRDAYFILGDNERIPLRLEEAEALCEQLGDRTQIAWSRLQHSGFCWQSGRLQEAVDAADAALGVAQSEKNASLRSLAYYRRGLALCALGRFEESSTALLAALAWLDTDEGRSYFQLGGLPYCFACSFMAWSLAEMGELERAVEWGEKGYNFATEQGQAYSQCVSAFGLSHALIYLHRGEECRPILERAYELGLSGETKSTVPWLGTKLSRIHAIAGRQDLAHIVLEESRYAEGPQHAYTHFEIGRALFAANKFDDALDALATAKSIGQVQAEASVVAWADWLIAVIARERGDDSASDTIAAVGALASQRGWGTLARACA
jgi:class 3 adenylate cyclase/tetratricopeptide (TPR) repeat protein